MGRPKGSKNKPKAIMPPLEGEWIVRNRIASDEKGMSPIGPAPKVKGVLTNDEIRDIVREEGIGLAVHCYIPVKHVEDERLRLLWCEAKERLIKIMRYLYE